MAKAGAEAGAEGVKVLHVSWLKRSDGEPGGVEKFACYLERALTEAGHSCQVIAWSDFPNRGRCERLSNPDKALVLGSWAESELHFDIAVSDGYWGLGITQRKVVPVVHGTWAQFYLNMRSSPWTNAEVQAQHQAFTAPNVFPVACSPASARELERHHRRQPIRTILHGIDLDLFRPQKSSRADGRPIVLHAATNPKKGSDLMPAIARELGDSYRVEFLNAAVGEEAAAFQRGDIFLHPSRHEGNAYALLEAMGTGLPIVTTSVGLFESIAAGLVGPVLPIDATVSQWAEAVREAAVNSVAYGRAARATAKRMASFDHFRSEWVAFLEELS